MNKKYIVLKLVTGEELLATLENKPSDNVVISNPMKIQVFHEQDEDGNLIPNVSATPWCEYSATKKYTIYLNHVILLEDLHEELVEHYLNLVKAFETKVTATVDSQGYVSEVENTQPDPEPKKRIVH